MKGYTRDPIVGSLVRWEQPRRSRVENQVFITGIVVDMVPPKTPPSEHSCRQDLDGDTSYVIRIGDEYVRPELGTWFKVLDSHPRFHEGVRVYFYPRRPPDMDRRIDGTVVQIVQAEEMPVRIADVSFPPSNIQPLTSFIIWAEGRYHWPHPKHVFPQEEGVEAIEAPQETQEVPSSPEETHSLASEGFKPWDIVLFTPCGGWRSSREPRVGVLIQEVQPGEAPPQFKLDIKGSLSIRAVTTWVIECGKRRHRAYLPDISPSKTPQEDRALLLRRYARVPKWYKNWEKSQKQVQGLLFPEDILPEAKPERGPEEPPKSNSEGRFGIGDYVLFSKKGHSERYPGIIYRKYAPGELPEHSPSHPESKLSGNIAKAEVSYIVFSLRGFQFWKGDSQLQLMDTEEVKKLPPCTLNLVVGRSVVFYPTHRGDRFKGIRRVGEITLALAPGELPPRALRNSHSRRKYTIARTTPSYFIWSGDEEYWVLCYHTYPGEPVPQEVPKAAPEPPAFKPVKVSRLPVPEAAPTSTTPEEAAADSPRVIHKERTPGWGQSGVNPDLHNAMLECVKVSLEEPDSALRELLLYLKHPLPALEAAPESSAPEVDDSLEEINRMEHLVMAALKARLGSPTETEAEFIHRMGEALKTKEPKGPTIQGYIPGGLPQRGDMPCPPEIEAHIQEAIAKHAEPPKKRKIFDWLLGWRSGA